MANFNKSHPLNAAGSLFTDTTCIDCETCYHLGPSLFRENGPDHKSIVVKQPQTDDEWQEAKRAILSCPTNSIGVKDAPQVFRELGPGLPFLIKDDVYYNGYTSRDSFGATSYLIVRKEGNILVDSPKFHPWLVKEIERLGGVSKMILTHRDDVADHEKFHAHFLCDRYIHKADVTEETKDCEQILQGEDSLFLSPDLKIIMTPGHSKGHINLLYRSTFLFTGDHLFVDAERKIITASKSVSWYSWNEQIKSVEKLLKEDFQWIMPGHGGWGYFGNEGRNELQKLILRMKQQ